MVVACINSMILTVHYKLMYAEVDYELNQWKKTSRHESYCAWWWISYLYNEGSNWRFVEQVEMTDMYNSPVWDILSYQQLLESVVSTTNQLLPGQWYSSREYNTYSWYENIACPALGQTAGYVSDVWFAVGEPVNQFVPHRSVSHRHSAHPSNL